MIDSHFLATFLYYYRRIGITETLTFFDANAIDTFQSVATGSKQGMAFLFILQAKGRVWENIVYDQLDCEQKMMLESKDGQGKETTE